MTEWTWPSARASAVPRHSARSRQMRRALTDLSPAPHAREPESARRELIGEAPKNRIAISVWPSAEAEQSFWNDTHDDFKMAQQKYTTDMRLYALEGVAQK